jgi:hypothetical protein
MDLKVVTITRGNFWRELMIVGAATKQTRLIHFQNEFKMGKW